MIYYAHTIKSPETYCSEILILVAYSQIVIMNEWWMPALYKRRQKQPAACSSTDTPAVEPVTLPIATTSSVETNPTGIAGLASVTLPVISEPASAMIGKGVPSTGSVCVIHSVGSPQADTSSRSGFHSLQLFCDPKPM